MAEPATPSKKDTLNSAGAESPTTARPLDFDDDQQETGVIQTDGTATTTTAATATPPVPSKSPPPRSTSRGVRFEEEEDAPPKPPRPADRKAETEATLIEAFPSIDIKIVRAVLAASGGQIEPAFNALLGMSDPDFQDEAPAPPPPPRPNQQQSQMEQDEMYARQLAEHYNTGTQGYDGQRSQRRQQLQRAPGERDEREYSFFDDELPEIQKNIKQGFLQTQSKVNKWISDFKKRMDGDEEEEPPALPGRPAGSGSSQQRQNFGSSQAEQLRGIQKNAQTTRRMQQQDRYDSDPQLISDNFNELELRDDEAPEAPPKKAARPLANPDLFKPTPPPPQTGPVDEVDAALQTGSAPNSSTKSKKWQPLTTLAPNPDTEDNDPFSLGDSDDDAVASHKTKDTNPEDTQRLKEAASNATADDSTASEEKKTLEPKERSGSKGTRDKEAEELMKS